MNKKEKRIALLSALSSKVADNKIVVLDAFNLDEVKTKKFAEVMSNLKVDKALVVIEGENKNVVLSGRNIPTVKVSATNEINTYDVLKYETLVVGPRMSIWRRWSPPGRTTTPDFCRTTT